MKRGPPPQPTYLKLIRGNPGKRPLNQNEPKPPQAKRIPRPTELVQQDPIAVACWKRTTKHLRSMKLLHHVDLTTIEQFCMWYAHWYRAEKQLQQDGGDVLGAGTAVSPYKHHHCFSIAKRSSEQMYRYAQELGLTPSSRSRISLLQQADDGDEIFN